MLLLLQYANDKLLSRSLVVWGVQKTVAYGDGQAGWGMGNLSTCFLSVCNSQATLYTPVCVCVYV